LKVYRRNGSAYRKGEFGITDETGYSVTAKPGDVFYFEKGIDPSE